MTTVVKTALLLLALTVGVALSTPCTDQCFSACNIAKTNCDGAIVLGPVCGISFGMCSQGCAAICGCSDGCQAQCAPALTACKEKAPNQLFAAQCTVENDVCIADCGAMCATQQVGQTISAAVASVFAPAA